MLDTDFERQSVVSWPKNRPYLNIGDTVRLTNESDIPVRERGAFYWVDCLMTHQGIHYVKIMREYGFDEKNKYHNRVVPEEIIQKVTDQKDKQNATNYSNRQRPSR